jgi:hypothetical protein
MQLHENHAVENKTDSVQLSPKSEQIPVFKTTSVWNHDASDRKVSLWLFILLINRLGGYRLLYKINYIRNRFMYLSDKKMYLCIYRIKKYFSE